MNVDIDNPVGSLKPRAGYLQCGVSPSTASTTNAYVYSRTDGSENLILTDNNTIWSTRDCVTFSTITTGLGFNNIPNFATVRNKLWAVNGSTHVITWDGSTAGLLDGRAGTPSPAPPKSRYIAFWKERVWLARTTTDPSAVYFSALEDSSGNDIDPSTGSAAWPATNAIYVDQDGGSPIYGIAPFCDQMKVYKENGRWGISFNSQFDNAVVKDFSNPGTRYQASIVDHDGLQHFVGRDGIYASDCSQAKRISEAFNTKFGDVSQSNVDSSFKTWDTDSDFSAGSLSSATVSDGSVFIASRTAIIQDFDRGLGTWTCIPASDPGATIQSKCGVYNSTNTQFGSLVIGSYSASVTGNTPSDTGTLYIFTVAGTTIAQSGATIGGCTLGALSSGGSISTYTVSCSGQAGQSVYLHFTGNGTHLYSSSFTIGTTLTFQYLNTASEAINMLDNFQSRLFFSTGIWTSEIYNLVTVSSFSSFEAESSLSGGNIAYFVRVGTSATAITQNNYYSITPGALITGTTADIYIQVKASETAPSTLDASPELQNVTVNVVQGSGSNQQIYAISFLGNLYVSASTGTSATNNLVFKKSRSPNESWTLYDWRVGPMVNFTDRLYAASSDGRGINRMLYGTNDNGTAISWYWTSRDEAWGDPGVSKRLLEITGDLRSSTASNLMVGYSRDHGLTFTNSTFSATAAGRGTFRRFVNGGYASDYRLYIGGSTLDETAVITGLAGWAKMLNLRE